MKCILKIRYVHFAFIKHRHITSRYRIKRWDDKGNRKSFSTANVEVLPMLLKSKVFCISHILSFMTPTLFVHMLRDSIYLSNKHKRVGVIKIKCVFWPYEIL